MSLSDEAVEIKQVKLKKLTFILLNFLLRLFPSELQMLVDLDSTFDAIYRDILI